MWLLGLVIKAFESFVRDTYGSAVWRRIVNATEVRYSGFVSMLSYPSDTACNLVRAAEAEVEKGVPALLEDFGTYLVTHPNFEVLRRLLRFCGDEIEDFLLALDELPDRARLAVPDLELPPVMVDVLSEDVFQITCGCSLHGFGRVLTGAIRAMADDYGALVVIEMEPNSQPGAETIVVTVHDRSFSKGRSFQLAGETL